jgi:hypothetical protein
LITTSYWGLVVKPPMDCSKVIHGRSELAKSSGPATAAALSLSLISYFLFFSDRSKLNPWKKTRPKEKTNREKRRRGLVEAMGNTPLIRINSLSDATGCEVHCLFLFFVFYWAREARYFYHSPIVSV